MVAAIDGHPTAGGKLTIVGSFVVQGSGRDEGMGAVMELSDVEWGDVLVDTGEVVVCEGRVDGDAVVVKRWSQGALDAERAARRALGGAGVACAQLLGWGEDWLVVEDLTETMWRPAHEGELDDEDVARALGAWFARVHAVDGNGLPRPAQEALMEQGLAGAAEELIDPSLAGRLDALVDQWLQTSRAATSLVVGAFGPDDVAVVGRGMDAMATDWSQAHQGQPAEDLHLVLDVLSAPASDAFRRGYETAGGPWPSVEQWQAARGLGMVLHLAVSDLTGNPVDPGVARWLDEQVRG